MSNTRWSVPMSGFAFLSRTMSLENPIIISLSHSGQTFPTLHATHTFRKLCGDRVFVVTGSWTRKWVRLLVSWVMQGRPGLRAHGLRLQVVITHMQKSQICAHSAHTCMLNVAFDVTVSSFRVSGYLLCVPVDIACIHRMATCWGFDRSASNIIVHFLYSFFFFDTSCSRHNILHLSAKQAGFK